MPTLLPGHKKWRLSPYAWFSLPSAHSRLQSSWCGKPRAHAEQQRPWTGRLMQALCSCTSRTQRTSSRCPPANPLTPPSFPLQIFCQVNNSSSGSLIPTRLIHLQTSV